MAPPPPSNKPSPLVLPELLEEVIMHLPLRDILLCQRVDTHFRDVVQRSSNIKKVLFLEPAISNNDVSCEWVRHQLGHGHHSKDVHAHWKMSRDGEVVNPLLNPFLMSVSAKKERFWEWAPFDRFEHTPRPLSKWSQSSLHMIISGPWIKTAAKICTPDALATSTASYARMLITHPPCTSIRTRAYDLNLGIKADDHEPQRSAIGVRFAAILETAAKVLFVQTRVCSRARPFGQLDLLISDHHLWRICPESMLDHVTGWEMLSLMTNQETMHDDIDRTITARNKWDYVADGKSNDENKQKGPFAWEEETANQGDPFETMAADFGACLNSW